MQLWSLAYSAYELRSAEHLTTTDPRLQALTVRLIETLVPFLHGRAGVPDYLMWSLEGLVDRMRAMARP